jgi:hypothetical protein
MGCLKLQEKFGSKLRVVYCSATNASGKLVEQRRFDAWEGGALKKELKVINKRLEKLELRAK